MSTAAMVLLVATITGVDGGTAQLAVGLAHGLRPGDTGQVFYRLTVGSETRRVEVGEATVIEADELGASCTVPAGKTRPGFMIEFELPADRAGPEAMLELARSRLSTLADGDLDERVRFWVDRLIPEDPRLEDAVTRILAERRPPPLGEGPVASPEASALPASIEAPSRDTVLIPARIYLVGLDLREAEFYSQQPRFAIELESFLFDTTPVTKAEFLRFRQGFVFPDAAGEAATGVSWGDAAAFCRWRDMRLPTEFEWEIAVQAAESEGEVLEWTSSWYEPYPGNRIPEPEYGQKFRVVRGGVGEASFDVHRRRFVAPDSRHRQLGFRCAGDPQVAGAAESGR